MILDNTHMAEVPLKNSTMHLSAHLKHSLKDEGIVAVAFRSYFLELSWAIPTQPKHPSRKAILLVQTRIISLQSLFLSQKS